jgi:hypothetical protein
MAWGTATIEGVTFRETFTVSENGDSFTLSGQESTPPLSRGDVLQLHANVVGLEGRIVPIVFSGKAERNGFYLVTSSSSDLFDWNGYLVTADWKLTATKIGSGSDVEFESRVPTIMRANDGGVAPVYWHAAPVGCTSYYTGATVPNYVTRASADGAVPVFTSLPVGVAPRWTVGVLDYMRGAVDLRLDGRMALGTMTPHGVSAWSMDNGIVRISNGASGSINTEMWNGSAWVAMKGYQFTVNGTALTATPDFTVMRNDTEETVVRLTFPGVPGRTQVDLSLRRGARFVTTFIGRHSVATLGVTRTTAEAANMGSAGGRATSPDGSGATFILGSTKNVTTTTATASIARASVSRLDAFVGYTGADADYAALLSQYFGTNGDRTRVVQR